MRGAFTQEAKSSASKIVVNEEQREKKQRDAIPVPQKKVEPINGNGEKTWAKLFSGNRMAARGMDLVFVPPLIQDGIRKAQLKQDETKIENEKWKKAIMPYVIGESPPIGATERFIASQWNFAAKPKVYYHNEGYFVILFNTVEDKK